MPKVFAFSASKLWFFNLNYWAHQCVETFMFQVYRQSCIEAERQESYALARFAGTQEGRVGLSFPSALSCFGVGNQKRTAT